MAFEKSMTVLSRKFHVVLADLGGNAVMSKMLSKIVAVSLSLSLSLVMALYEKRSKNDCGVDHHRQISPC